MDIYSEDTGRDYDEMLYAHASQLMSIRGLASDKATAASVSLLKCVFSADPDFAAWLAKRRAFPEPTTK